MRLVFQFITGLLLLSLISARSAYAEEGADRLLVISESLKALQNEIPAYFLSPEALAESNDYEPEQIIGWIKKNVQFSPSPGYQLTPQAALQTATGNALEQAVLLQNVLVQAGLEVRLAQAVLTREQTTALLKQSFEASPAKAWELDPALREAQFRHISLALNAPQDTVNDNYLVRENLTPWVESPVYNKATTLANTLSQAMSSAKAWEADETLLEPWIANAQDYYFVKYRFAQGEPWAQAHPAFTATDPVIEKSSYLVDGIEGQHHKITLQAFIDRKIDGKTERVAVSGIHERSSAQLFTRQLHFVTVASAAKKAIEQRSRSALEQRQFFAPVIDGQLANSARYFGLDGRDLSPAEVNDPMGKLGGATSEKLGEVTGTLSGALGGPAEGSGAPKKRAVESKLLHYYLVIKWQAPNGQSRTVERTIYRHDPAHTPERVYQAIMQRAILAATPASLTPAAELFESLATQRSVFELAAKLTAGPYTDAQVSSKIDTWLNQRNDLAFHAAAQLSASTTQAHGAAAVFSQAPMIAMRWDQQSAEASGSQYWGENGLVTFDYLINSGQVAVASGEAIAIDQAKTLEYGVWSTYAEALLLSEEMQRESLSQKTVSAANEFNQVLAQGKLTLVDGTAELPQVLSQRIQANPDYAYLLPAPGAQGLPPAYYRVHTVTGETLGYTLDGRGSTSAETSMLIELDLATVLAIGKMASCFFGEGDSGAQVAGCLACGLVEYAVAGLVILRGLSNVAAAVAAGSVELPCNFI